MAESTVDWFIVREKYWWMADIWLISPNEQYCWGCLGLLCSTFFSSTPRFLAKQFQLHALNSSKKGGVVRAPKEILHKLHFFLELLRDGICGAEFVEQSHSSLKHLCAELLEFPHRKKNRIRLLESCTRRRSSAMRWSGEPNERLSEALVQVVAVVVGFSLV